MLSRLYRGYGNIRQVSVWCAHDNKVQARGGGTIEISALNYTEIQRQVEHCLTTLQEAVREARRYGRPIYLDIKFDAGIENRNFLDLRRELLAANANLKNAIGLAAYSFEDVKRLRSVFPQVIIALAGAIPASAEDYPAFLQSAQTAGARIFDTYGPDLTGRDARYRVNPRFVRKAQALGFTVWSFTLNSPAEILSALDWGVRGITTDRVAETVALRNKWAARVSSSF